jgi:tetratricopeptide (TPR) repeat protein
MQWRRLASKSEVAKNFSDKVAEALGGLGGTQLKTCKVCSQEYIPTAFLSRQIVISEETDFVLCRQCACTAIASLSSAFLEGAEDKLPDSVQSKNKRGLLYHSLGKEEAYAGNGANASEAYSHALETFIDVGNYYSLAGTLSNIAILRHERGNDDWAKYMKSSLLYGQITGHSKPLLLSLIHAAMNLTETLCEEAWEQAECPEEDAVSLKSYELDDIVSLVSSACAFDTYEDNLDSYVVENSLQIFDIFSILGDVMACRKILEAVNTRLPGLSDPLLWKVRVAAADLAWLEGNIQASLEIYSGALSDSSNIMAIAQSSDVAFGVFSNWKKIADETKELLERSFKEIEDANQLVMKIDAIESAQRRGLAFEESVRQVLEACGFIVLGKTAIEFAGHRFELDLIVKENVAALPWSDEIVVECKLWNRPVDRDAILKLAFLKSEGRFNRFLLISQGSVSSGALALAKDRGIGILSFDDLVDIAKDINEQRARRLLHECKNESRLIKKDGYEFKVRLFRSGSLETTFREDVISVIDSESARSLLRELNVDPLNIVEVSERSSGLLAEYGYEDEAVLRLLLSLSMHKPCP